MSLNTTPSTWVASAVLTAAQLNLQVRDALTGIQAAWTSYTPALTNITIGNGTRTFAWSRVGKTIYVRGRFAAGGTTSYSAGTLGIAAPTTPHSDYLGAVDHAVGSAIIKPTTLQSATVVFATTAGGVFNFFVDNVGSGGLVTNTNPGVFATASIITFTATYEAA